MWLKGAYRIPAVEPPDGFSEEDAEALARGAEETRE